MGLYANCMCFSISLQKLLLQKADGTCKDVLRREQVAWVLRGGRVCATEYSVGLDHVGSAPNAPALDLGPSSVIRDT